MVDVVGVRRIACGRSGCDSTNRDRGLRALVARADAEGLNIQNFAIGVHQLLSKARSFIRRVAEKPLGSRKSTEIRIERAVLLVEDKNVFHLLFQQVDQVSVPHFGFMVDVVLVDELSMVARLIFPCPQYSGR